VSGLKDKKLIKKQTYMKSEAYKLYSGVFWIFLPNIIKIEPYNFELYRFKVDEFFWDTVYIADNRCADAWSNLSKLICKHYLLSGRSSI